MAAGGTTKYEEPIPGLIIYRSASLPGTISRDLIDRYISWRDEHHAALAKPVCNRSGILGANPRYRIQFGMEYNPDGTYSMLPDKSMPEPINEMAEACDELYRVYHMDEEVVFDQCIINFYDKKQGIGPHIDDCVVFGPVIGCITLGGSRTMYFKKDGVRCDVKLAHGDIYFMTKEARFSWTHEMPKLVTNSKCESITFRSIVV